jgi:enterochelin esterase-like enzyme
VSRMAWVLIISALGCVRAQEAPRGTPGPLPAIGHERAIVSPELQPDGQTTFRLSAPDAHSVVLQGDWPGGGPRTSIPMTKGPDGVWSTTTPLTPEYWTYRFRVDGVPALDPANPLTSSGRSEVVNTLVVPGALSENYEVRNVPHGTVAAVWLPTPSLHDNSSRRTYVYTPPGYETGKQRYPVLYLMHGGGGDEEDWLSAGRTTVILDNMIASGHAKPLIAVLLNTNPEQRAAADYEKRVVPTSLDVQFAGFVPWSQALYTDVIPAIDRMYRTDATAGSRAVAGFSQGAAASLYFAAHHPETVAWVGVLSCGCLILPEARISVEIPARDGQPARQGMSIDRARTEADLPLLNAAANGKIKLLYLIVGSNDGLIVPLGVVRGILDSRGVKYTYREEPGYGHEMRLARIGLQDFVSKAFH